MTSYKKFGTVKVNGVKKIVYHKEGSTKNYVVYKGRHVGLSKYKSMMAKKMAKKRGGNIVGDFTRTVGSMFGRRGGDDEKVVGGSGSFLADAFAMIKGGKSRKVRKVAKKPKKSVRKTRRVSKK